MLFSYHDPGSIARSCPKLVKILFFLFHWFSQAVPPLILGVENLIGDLINDISSGAGRSSTINWGTKGSVLSFQDRTALFSPSISSGCRIYYQLSLPEERRCLVLKDLLAEHGSVLTYLIRPRDRPHTLIPLIQGILKIQLFCMFES